MTLHVFLFIKYIIYLCIRMYNNKDFRSVIRLNNYMLLNNTVDRSFPIFMLFDMNYNITYCLFHELCSNPLIKSVSVKCWCHMAWYCILEVGRAGRAGWDSPQNLWLYPPTATGKLPPCFEKTFSLEVVLMSMKDRFSLFLYSVAR